MVGHRYTEAEHTFLRKFVPGHTYSEIVEEYNKTFSDPITVSRVKGYIGNHKLNTGKTGRFEKGRIPFNKGKKGWCAPGTEKTRFKAGHLPHNTKPIGYERITKDGYVEVKIKMRPSNPNCNDNFVLKQRLVWEEAHGPIPEGCNVIFLDGNKKNVELKNLALVNRAEHLQMTRKKLRTENAELTKTGVLIAKASCTSTNKKKESRRKHNEKIQYRKESKKRDKRLRRTV